MHGFHEEPYRFSEVHVEFLRMTSSNPLRFGINTTDVINRFNILTGKYFIKNTLNLVQILADSNSSEFKPNKNNLSIQRC